MRQKRFEPADYDFRRPEMLNDLPSLTGSVLGLPTEYLQSLLDHRRLVEVMAQWIGGISPVQIALHDLSKLEPIESVGYIDHFFGDKSRPDLFDMAWLHHQNVNLHHWEFWLPRTLHSGNPASTQDGLLSIAMPAVYVREMIADWHARGYEVTGQADISEWFNAKMDAGAFTMHPETWETLYQVLNSIGYRETDGKLSPFTWFAPPSQF